MNKFLQLPADTRRTIYEQVSLRLGIDDPKAIEKDIWVTGILQAVFEQGVEFDFQVLGGHRPCH